MPLLNLAVSGIFSASIALLFDLEKLIEFMSIGTLLAYTIVSASVIILRYKNEPIIEGEDEKSISADSTQSDSFLYSPGGKLKSEFRWLSKFVDRTGRGKTISVSVLSFISCSVLLFVHMQFSGSYILKGDSWAIATLAILIFFCSGSLLLIACHRQNPSTNTFRVPCVPLIPGLSILCNVGLMVHLNTLTWVRFTVWMTLGLLVYFIYGMNHSKEKDVNDAYTMLMTSSEAIKEPWGTINARNDSSGANEPNEMADAKNSDENQRSDEK